MIKTFPTWLGLVFLLATYLPTVYAQSPGVVQGQPGSVQGQASSAPENYILSPTDIVLVKVFEQPALDSHFSTHRPGPSLRGDRDSGGKHDPGQADERLSA